MPLLKPSRQSVFPRQTALTPRVIALFPPRQVVHRQTALITRQSALLKPPRQLIPRCSVLTPREIALFPQAGGFWADSTDSRAFSALPQATNSQQAVSNFQVGRKDISSSRPQAVSTDFWGSSTGSQASSTASQTGSTASQGASTASTRQIGRQLGLGLTIPGVLPDCPLRTEVTHWKTLI